MIIAYVLFTSLFAMFQRNYALLSLSPLLNLALYVSLASTLFLTFLFWGCVSVHMHTHRYLVICVGSQLTQS